MPPEQRLGPDEESSPTLPPEEPAQPGEERSVSWPECGAGHLAAQDRDLVSEHDDLDGQFLSLVATNPEQLEDANEGDIEEGERNNPSWPIASSWRRSR
jgi:hypothetical protein